MAESTSYIFDDQDDNDANNDLLCNIIDPKSIKQQRKKQRERRQKDHKFKLLRRSVISRIKCLSIPTKDDWKLMKNVNVTNHEIYHFCENSLYYELSKYELSPAEFTEIFGSSAPTATIIRNRSNVYKTINQRIHDCVNGVVGKKVRAPKAGIKYYAVRVTQGADDFKCEELVRLNIEIEKYNKALLFKTDPTKLPLLVSFPAGKYIHNMNGDPVIYIKISNEPLKNTLNGKSVILGNTGLMYQNIATLILLKHWVKGGKKFEEMISNQTGKWLKEMMSFVKLCAMMEERDVVQKMLGVIKKGMMMHCYKMIGLRNNYDNESKNNKKPSPLRLSNTNLVKVPQPDITHKSYYINNNHNQRSSSTSSSSTSPAKKWIFKSPNSNSSS